MTEAVEIPVTPRFRLPDTAPLGLGLLPGRNHPGIGRWLLDTFCPGKRAVVADPFCGGGQLWMDRRPGDAVVGCDINPARVLIAERNGIHPVIGDAQTWAPYGAVNLVAFSPPYPNCDHDSGKGKAQLEMVAQRGAHAMQCIEPPPDMLRVFLHIATWRGVAPVAVIARNSIEGQVEVDWVSELEASMRFAGLGEVRRFFRRIPPGMTEQWKVARGEYSAKTGQLHRVVDREWVLVAEVPR